MGRFLIKPLLRLIGWLILYIQYRDISKMNEVLKASFNGDYASVTLDVALSIFIILFIILILVFMTVYVYRSIYPI